jgi:hypothetical protein
MSKHKIECPSCAMEVDADSRNCPICDYEFARPNPVLKWVVLFLVVLFLLYSIL